MDKVIWYSGTRGKERPLKIIYKNIEYFVDDIVSHKIIEELDTQYRWEEYVCRCGDKFFFLKEEITGWRIEEYERKE